MQLGRLLRVLLPAVFSLTTAAPAFAGVADRVSFQIAPRVASQVLQSEANETSLLIASNSAFNINATGLIGTVTITIETSGHLGGKTFGSASQLPGQKKTEIFLTSAFETPIYRADRKTARSPGYPIDQAVLVRISHADASNPTFSVEPGL